MNFATKVKIWKRTFSFTWIRAGYVRKFQFWNRGSQKSRPYRIWIMVSIRQLVHLNLFINHSRLVFPHLFLQYLLSSLSARLSKCRLSCSAPWPLLPSRLPSACLLWDYSLRQNGESFRLAVFSDQPTSAGCIFVSLVFLNTIGKRQ